MSRQLVVRPRADWELEDIVQWIAERDVRAARRFRERFEETLRKMEQFPFLGSKAVTPEGTFWIRQVLKYRRFVIIYQVTDTTIDVLRVIRGSRNNRLLPGD
jgi:plasmid stabilization system protein ParE